MRGRPGQRELRAARQTSKPVPLKISTTRGGGAAVLGTSAFTYRPGVLIHKWPRRSSHATPASLSRCLATAEIRSATTNIRRHARSLLAFGDEGRIALADDAHLLHDQVCATDTDPTDS